MASLVTRQNFVLGLVGFYVIYAIGGIGLTGLLFSFAIGLIVNSVTEDLELTGAGIILSGLLWKIVMDWRRREGFQAGVPLGTGQSGIAISKKVEEVGRKNVFQPSGVLSSCFVEGFADATVTDAPLPDSGDKAAKPAGEATPPPATSTPASTQAPTATANLAKDLPTANAAAEAAPKEEKKADGFADPLTSGMFKLGSIPADAVGGSHIDVGTTLMNALNALKPDQVKAMTDDTRKLMETQKSLMGMLTTMKPMMSEGKQMMETFSQMFGKQ